MVSFSCLKKVDFSSFIFMENTGLIVHLDSKLHSVSDVDGKWIAVIAGTTNEGALAKKLQRRQIQVKIVRVKDRRERMVWLESKVVDSFASDRLQLIEAPDMAASCALPEPRMIPSSSCSEITRC